MSAPEDRLAYQLRAVGLPKPEREYKFALPRKWRFDFAYPDLKLAIEVEGGTWVNGAHTRGGHYESDCRKYNRAALLGWRVLRFTTGMVDSGEAIDRIEEAFQRYGADWAGL